MNDDAPLFRPGGFARARFGGGIVHLGAERCKTKSATIIPIETRARRHSFPPMKLHTWLYLILFIGFFPVLWGGSAYLDRVWPTTTELLKERGEEIKQEDIPE
ncbi:MAG TPA: hypothetical protein VMW68_03945 [Methyloceanibacter sp.]|nr:hypothetical protein [Methyloceanibacter sp.]